MFTRFVYICAMITQITQTNIGGGGRLGNCLFGIAAVIGTAQKLGAQAVIPDWSYSKHFEESLPIGSISPTHAYKEPAFNYTEIDLNNATMLYGRDNKVYDLQGYFQSEKYFNHCSDLIRNTFIPSKEIAFMCAEYFFHYPVTCSVHVRRGDYVGNPFYAQLDINYYKQAIEYIKETTGTERFLIFSDDINWCKDHFIGDEYEFSEGKKDVEDLFLMAECNHNIISNSSFSWWASYLNRYLDKTIVAPNKNNWFAPDSKFNVDDLYLPNWVTI